MLRIIQLANSAAAKAYYKSSDYFLDGQELPGVWAGHGAKLLGLSGEVEKTHFDRLCDNLHPHSKKQLTAKHIENRRVGWDFNWHAEKSVSVCYEVLGDERVLDAFRDAVSYAMGQVEADMKTRVRIGGADEDREVGNAVYATFIHRTARPVNGVPDPHLHAHSVLFNSVFDDVEGKWKAAQMADLQKHSGYYAALMQAKLAENMVAIGYGVERKGKYWQVAGVPQSVLDKFSRRTKLIEATAAAKGIENESWKGELGAKTREKKQDHLTVEQLREEWLSRLTNIERESLANLPGQEKPLPSADASMVYAIAHHFERSSIVPEKRVYEEALRFGVGSVDLDGLKRAANQQGLLVKGEDSTTREALERERRLIQFARDGRGTRQKLGEGRLLASRLPPGTSGAAPQGGKKLFDRKDPITLNPGQSSAVKHILSSKDRVVLVRGAAGTGKTTMLRAAVEQMNAPVRAIGISSTAAEELAKEVTPASSTVARFLLDKKMQREIKDGVVLLDEASLIGTKQMDALVDVLEEQNARLVMVGDLKQHSGVQAGSPFRALQDVAKLPVVEVTEIMRQSGLYKEVSSRLSKGQTGKAIDLLEQMGWVKEGDYETRTNELVADYLDAVQKKRSVLVVAPTHKEGEDVTFAIRSALKAKGKLGDEREFTRLVPLNQTAAERGRLDSLPVGAVAEFHKKAGEFKAGQRVAADVAVSQPGESYATYQTAQLPLAVGDAVRITKNGKTKDEKHRLLNGGTYTVKGFKNGDIVLNNGWVVDKDYGHWNHGYVSTSHASQGKTVDTVLVVESSTSFPAASTEQFYVSLSRGKRHAYLYTDSLPDLKEAVSRERPQMNASDLVELVPNRVKAVALLNERVKQIARKAKGMAKKVRQMTKQPREKDYGLEMG